MKTTKLIILAALVLILWCSAYAQQNASSPGPQTTASAAVQPTAIPAPPPSAPPKRSVADLEKLVAPIALFPDPLIATLLPASVYPLEIVQAARFVADTNNLAKLDTQPWDDNVKAVARVPAVIKKMNDDISWTIELGEAFLSQDKEVMDAIQSMRGKAQKAGTLQTSPQQIVTVTNIIVEKTVEQQVVVVTNTIVQIQSSNPQVVYVPSYDPYVVYYPPPAYVYNPYAPLVTFGVGMAMGAIIANNCDWHGGGCYHSDVDIDIDRTVNRERNVDRNNSANQGARASSTSGQKKWQPDQNRLGKSGSPTATARNAEARGWGSGSGGPSTSTWNRPSTGNTAARPSTGNVGARPSTGASPANRPSASPGTSRQSPSSSTSQFQSASPSSRSSSSAFSGTSSGASARNSSSRGSSSRGGGGGGRSGGGGRGGGGGRR